MKHLAKLGAVAALVVLLAAPAAHAVIEDPNTSQFGLGYAAEIGLGTQDVRTTISNILNVAMGLLGIIAVCIILYGGFKWMTAAGNDDAVKTAKKLIIQGVIGLVVIVSAYAIAQFVISSLITATTSS